MLKVTLLLFATSIFACTHLIANSSHHSSFGQSAMSSSHVSVKPARLIVRNKTLAPIGASSSQNYPMKSAAVFVEVENLQEVDTKVLVQKVEVRGLESDRLELVSNEPQEILLRPLETSIRDFHLSQKGTFQQSHQVKAIITLKIDGKTQTIASNSVEVQPY